MGRTGRDSIFKDKRPEHRVQALLSSTDAVTFEEHRKRLRQLVELHRKKAPKAVSDSDVIAYLLRGEVAVLKLLRQG